MATYWYEGRVTEIRQLTSTTKQFTLSMSSEEGIFDFLPGQFITMDLPVGEKRLQRWRSYSIASAPDKSNILELCIVKSDSGPGTKYLFEEVVVGSVLQFKGPDGGFILPAKLDHEIIMVCTGTGIAPFRSMIKYITDHNLTFKKIHLIFGTRYADGVLYRQEFEKLAKENPAFLYSVALSREKSEGFYHGYVHEVYLEKYQANVGDRHFYICGWTQMVDDAVANLILKSGYDKSQIHYELYG